MTGLGRVAVITGAARGIGAATVLALAADGWSVLAVDRALDDPALPYALATAADLAAVVAAAASLAGGTDRVAGFEADVRDATGLAVAVSDAERRWGGLDASVWAAVAMVLASGWILQRTQMGRALFRYGDSPTAAARIGNIDDFDIRERH